MEVYLLSVALSRHRLIVPQPRTTWPQTDALAASQPRCVVPALATMRVVDSSSAAMHRAPR